MGYPTQSRVAIGKRIVAAALTAAVAGAVCAPGMAMAADSGITPKGEAKAAATLADGVYAVDMQSNNTMFKPDEGLLRVKDGKAFASFVHSSYTFMYLGTGAEYEAARDAGTLESDPNYIKGTPVTIKDYSGKTLKAGSRFEFEITNLNEALAITTQSPSSSKTLARQICFDYDGSLTAGAEVFATVNVDGVNAMDVDADSTTAPAAMKNRSVVVKDLDGDG